MTPSRYADLVPQAAGAARLGFDEGRASAFAKGVAGDFNPLHDPGDRRFCVPGDLLFALLLEHYGLYRETSVGFASMVGADAELTLPVLAGADGRGGPSDAGGTGDAAGVGKTGGPGEAGGVVHVADARGRQVLSFFAAGGRTGTHALVAALTLEYVRFSGRTFPEILVPLMREQGVMVNPERPLIIYKDMAIRMDAAPGADAVPVLKDGEHRLAVTNRKGVASIRFAIVDAANGDARLGEGEKNFVLGGLREHDDDTVTALVAEYDARRAAWREEAGA